MGISIFNPTGYSRTEIVTVNVEFNKASVFDGTLTPVSKVECTPEYAYDSETKSIKETGMTNLHFEVTIEPLSV